MDFFQQLEGAIDSIDAPLFTRLLISIDEQDIGYILNDVTKTSLLLTAINSDNIIAFRKLIDYGADPHILNGDSTTIYFNILKKLFDNFMLELDYPDIRYHNFYEFIELPLHYGNITDNLYKGEPNVYDFIFGNGLMNETTYNGLVSLNKEQEEKIKEMKEIVSGAISNVKKSHLMNSVQKLNIQKGISTGSKNSPLNYLDYDTFLELNNYLEEELPYTTANERFDPLESYVDYKKNKKKKDRTQKKKKKKKKTKKKWAGARGGGYLDMEKANIKEWENIHKLQKDCVPCALDLLGFDSKETKILAGLYGQKDGMPLDEVINIFSSKYPKHTFKFIDSGYFGNLLYNVKKITRALHNPNWTDITEYGEQDKNFLFTKYFEEYKYKIQKFFEEIFLNKQKKAVLGNYYFIVESGELKGHSVVYAKYNDHFIIYDAQVRESVIGIENITRRLLRNNVLYINYLWGHKKGKHPWNDFSYPIKKSQSQNTISDDLDNITTGIKEINYNTSRLPSYSPDIQLSS